MTDLFARTETWELVLVFFEWWCLFDDVDEKRELVVVVGFFEEEEVLLDVDLLEEDGVDECCDEEEVLVLEDVEEMCELVLVLLDCLLEDEDIDFDVVVVCLTDEPVLVEC